MVHRRLTTPSCATATGKSSQQSHNCFQAPNMVSDSGFHCWRDKQCLMHPTKLCRLQEGSQISGFKLYHYPISSHRLALRSFDLQRGAGVEILVCVSHASLNTFMGKRHRMRMAALVLAVVGGIAWLLLTSIKVEPVYQGKRLSTWLVELDKETQPASIWWTNGPAATAIQRIGTNGIPYLHAMLKAKDSRLK